MTIAVPSERSRAGKLLLDGELTLEIDGRSSTLVAQGDRLELHLPAGRRPGYRTGRALARRVVPVLDRAALRIDLMRGDRLVAALGSGVDSPAGWLLFGNRRIKPDLVATARSGIGDSFATRQRRAAVGATLLAAGLLYARGRARR